jgi:O-antigen ligase
VNDGVTTRRVNAMLALRPAAVWRGFREQGLVFWMLNAYLIVEYVRPQDLVPNLSLLPLGQISIGLTTFAFFLARDKLQIRSGAARLVLAYAVVVVASSIMAYSPAAAVDAWTVFFLWVVIYFLISSVVNTKERFFLFMLAWLLYNFYMSQGAARQSALRGFAFASWGVKGAPGWFANSGEFGIEMCLFLPLSWYFYQAIRPHARGWLRKSLVLLAPVTAVVGIVGSSSRGALLGGGAVAVTVLLQGGGRRLRAAIAVACLAGLAYTLIPEEQSQRIAEAGQDTTSTRRITYWQRGIEMTRSYPVLGVGYANWVPYYSSHFVDRSIQVNSALGYVQLSHNIFVQCMSELGLTGLAVFLSLIVATFVINARTRKLARAGPSADDYIVYMAYGLDAALVGYLVSGFFVTVLYYPFFWVNLAFTAALNVVARRQLAQNRPVTATEPVLTAASRGRALSERRRR